MMPDDPLFSPPSSDPQTAKEIIAADRAAHETKTAKLRAAREAKEAADLLALEPRKATAKAKAKKHPSHDPGAPTFRIDAQGRPVPAEACDI
jgi:hypothetical protein